MPNQHEIDAIEHFMREESELIMALQKQLGVPRTMVKDVLAQYRQKLLVDAIYALDERLREIQLNTDWIESIAQRR